MMQRTVIGRRWTALFLAAAVLFLHVPAVSLSAKAADADAFAGGSGTSEDPYLIETKAHLNNVRNYLDAHFKMIADITFTDADFAEGGDFYNDGQGWEPIGLSRSDPLLDTLMVMDTKYMAFVSTLIKLPRMEKLMPGCLVMGRRV